MKIYSMFHVLTLVVVLVFSMPLLTLAQENAAEPALSDQAQAIQDAERDANVNVNKPMWFAIGCLLPVGVGLLTPYFYQPSPPTAALLGKSPTYVAYYTDTYKQKTRNLQFTSAAGGCILGTLASVSAVAISVAAQQ